MNQGSRITFLIVRVILVALIVVIVVVSFFGFDITDEGYSVLISSPHQSSSGLVVRFGRIIRYLNEFIPIGIVEQRWIRLVLLLFSSYVLWIGVKKWYSSYIGIWDSAYTAFILLSGFTSYLWYPNALTYSAVSFSLSQLLLGIWFVYFSKQTGRRSLKIFSFSALISLLFYLLLITKFSSAISLFLIFCVASIAAFKFKMIAKKDLLLVPVSVVFITFLIVMVDRVSNEFSILDIFKTASIYQGLSSTHTLGAMLGELLNLLFFLSSFLLSGFLIVKSFRERQFRWLFFILPLVGFSLTWNPIRLAVWNWTLLFAALEFTCFGIIAYCISLERNKVKFLSVLFFILLFFSVIACYAGTDSPNILVFSVTSGILLPVFVLCKQSFFRDLAILVVSLSLVGVVIVQLVYVRYRQPPIFDQHAIYQPPVGLPVFMSEIDIERLHLLGKSLDELNFKQGDALIIPFAKPGLVYLLQGQSPIGILWSKRQVDAYFKMLQLYRNELPNQIYVISDDLLFIGALTESIEYCVFDETHKNSDVIYTLKRN